MGIAYDYGGAPSGPSPRPRVKKYISVSVRPWPSLFALSAVPPRPTAGSPLCAPAPAPVTAKIHLTPSVLPPKT